MANNDDLTAGLIRNALSAIGGAVIAFVGFRTQIALLKRKTHTESEIRKTEISRLEERFDIRLHTIERNQQVQLEILVDIAQAAGLDKRVTDGLLRMLAETKTNHQIQGE